MRSEAIDVARSVVRVSVSVLDRREGWTMQKRLNRSRCRLEAGSLMWCQKPCSRWGPYMPWEVKKLLRGPIVTNVQIMACSHLLPTLYVVRTVCLPSGRCRRVHWPPRRVTRGELYTVNPAMWPCTTKLLWTQLLPLSETAFRLCVRVNKWASFHGGVCKLQTRPEFSLCRCCYITTACRAAHGNFRPLSTDADRSSV